MPATVTSAAVRWQFSTAPSHAALCWRHPEGRAPGVQANLGRPKLHCCKGLIHFVIRPSFDTQTVDRKVGTQKLKVDTCWLIFLCRLRFIHFAFYCAFLGPSWKWVSLVLLNNSICNSQPHNPFLLLVSLLKRRLCSLWANLFLSPRPLSWKWFDFLSKATL